MNNKKNTKNKSNKMAKIVIAVLLVLGVAAGVFFYHRHVEAGKKILEANNRSANQNTKGVSNSTQTTSSNSSKDQASKSTNSSVKLPVPTGVFVSDHHPDLSGSPAPNLMSSNCNTLPGATCQITFTNNGVTKTLPVQTSNSSGTVYWTWKLQDIGLTAGNWQVKAITTFDGQTQTATDAMILEVSQ